MEDRLSCFKLFIVFNDNESTGSLNSDGLEWIEPSSPDKGSTGLKCFDI